MGIVVSLIVFAVGAILAFAVNNSPNGINIDAVGWVLMGVGLVSFLLTLYFLQTWWGPGYSRRARYVEGDPYARRGYGYAPARRGRVVEEVVEEEPAPPAEPPY
jgi:hypothetical protein